MKNKRRIILLILAFLLLSFFLYTVAIGEESPVLLDQVTDKPDTAAAFCFPLLGAYHISSPFGERVHPITGEEDFHEGVDLAAKRGTRICAIADGVVAASGYDETAGNYIRIDHGDGFLTLYAHCDRLIAKNGMQLRGGDVIAYVGTTGSSTGYHLHFAAKQEDSWFDPAHLLEELRGTSP